MPADVPPAFADDRGIAYLLDPPTQLAHLRSRLSVARSVLESADLDAPVPACPGWDVRAVARHLGEVHRWVVGAITEGHPDTRTPDGPRAREPLLAWFDDGAGRLVELLDGTDPEAPVWTFGPTPRTARFWFRRQAHEHAVHAVDLLAAAGAPPDVHVAPFAIDGIDEVVTMIFPRQVRLERIPPLAPSLALVPEEHPEVAFVLAGDGTAAPDAVDAQVTGPADALYLLLWGRVPLTDPRLRVTGDPAAAAGVLAAGIVP